MNLYISGDNENNRIEFTKFCDPNSFAPDMRLGWTDLPKSPQPELVRPTITDPSWYVAINGNRYRLDVKQILDFHRPIKKWWEIWK